MNPEFSAGTGENPNWDKTMRNAGEMMDGTYRNLPPGESTELHASTAPGEYRTHTIENVNGELRVDGNEYNPDDRYLGENGRLYRITSKTFESGNDATLQVDTEDAGPASIDEETV